MVNCRDVKLAPPQKKVIEKYIIIHTSNHVHTQVGKLQKMRQSLSTNMA